MYIKFQNKRNGEIFKTGKFASEDAMWNKYWALRNNKAFCGFEVIGL